MASALPPPHPSSPHSSTSSPLAPTITSTVLHRPPLHGANAANAVAASTNASTVANANSNVNGTTIASSNANINASTVSSSGSRPILGTGGGNGLRVPSNKRTIYDRNLNRTRNAELSKASFAYLFAEMVKYAQVRVTGIQDLERRLNQQGYPLGVRLLDLLTYRSLPAIPTSTLSGNTSSSSSSSASILTTTRPTRILPLLQFIHTSLYRHLFARSADALEKSSTNDFEYMLTDNDPLCNEFVSVPREMGSLNTAAFVAGIIEGVCDGAGMRAEVSAHNQGTEMWPSRTVFLIRFEGSVVERERLAERK